MRKCGILLKLLACFTVNVKKTKQIYVTKLIPQIYRMRECYFLRMELLHRYVPVKSKSTMYNLLVDLPALDISGMSGSNESAIMTKFQNVHGFIRCVTDIYKKIFCFDSI